MDELHLNGLSYQHIHGPVGAGMRLKWVAEGAVFNGVFTPQPYEPLAKVLRKMGRAADARRVLFEMVENPAYTWSAVVKYRQGARL